MTYVCAIKSPEGIKAVGITPDKAKAMGTLILSMTEELTDAVPEEWKNEPRITFSAWEYVYADDPGYGFRIEGTLWDDYVTINEPYKTLTGYGLSVGNDEEEEETDGER